MEAEQTGVMDSGAERILEGRKMRAIQPPSSFVL